MFAGIDVANYTRSNTVFWTETLNDDGTEKIYDMTVGQDASLFLGVKYYAKRIYNRNCGITPSDTDTELEIWQNGKLVTSLAPNADSDDINLFMAKGTYQIKVKVDWATGTVHDYSLRAYAPKTSGITFKRTQ